MTAAVGTARLDAGHWVIDAQPHVLIRLRRHFPRVNGHGAVRLKSTPETCRDLSWFCQRFPLDVDPVEALDEGAGAQDRLERDVARMLAGELRARPFTLAFPAREYQAVAAELALRTGGLLIADDVGLGKTVTAIAALTDPATRPALIVCYPHLQGQWQRELRRFAPDLAVHLIEKGQPYDITARMPRNPMIKGCGFPDVLVTTYHKLAGWADILGGKVRTVVYDEVQDLRHRNSQKWQAARHISEHAAYRIGLSATPFYNYGGELHNVMECLRPGALGAHHEFMTEWCIGNADKPKIKDPRAFGTYMRSSGLMLRRTRADVGRELPPVSIVPYAIDSDPKALDAVADRAAELARLILASDTEWQTRGESARELDIKLRQATGIAKAPYVAAFVRLLVESGEQVVLYGWHREVYSIWLDKLRDLDPLLYTGSETPAAKERAKAAFLVGEAKVLIMSLRSGAGLDGLQGVAKVVVFGELDWSPGVHEQCLGRVWRDGQTDPVVCYYLLADSGSDPIVADVLDLKKQQIGGVRDPGAELLEELEVDDGRLKRLAEQYLQSHGEKGGARG